MHYLGFKFQSNKESEIIEKIMLNRLQKNILRINFICKNGIYLPQNNRERQKKF